MHVWHIGSSEPRLLEWQYNQLADHVPSDRGIGRWEKLAIAVEVPAAST